MSQCDICGMRVKNDVCQGDYCPSNIDQRSIKDIQAGGCLIGVVAVKLLSLAATMWLFYTVWSLSK